MNSRHRTLENLLLNNKNKKKPEEQSGVYNINCSDCPAFYIGMTTRNMKKQFNEHQKNQPRSALGNHLNESNHNTKFENLKILHKESNYYKLTLLEQHEILKNKDSQHLLNEMSDFTIRDNSIFKLINSRQ